jgi:hypothetical protein
MATRKTAEAHGLRLTLPGATSEAHNIPGVPGWFWTHQPTPVGGPCDAITLEDARKYDSDPGMHLQLVELTVAEHAAARDHLDRFVRAVAGDLRAVAATAMGDERERVAEQLDSTRNAVTADVNSEEE